MANKVRWFCTKSNHTTLVHFVWHGCPGRPAERSEGSRRETSLAQGDMMVYQFLWPDLGDRFFLRLPPGSGLGEAGRECAALPAAAYDIIGAL